MLITPEVKSTRINFRPLYLITFFTLDI